jgi:NAD(P)H-dependent FMN reductase
MEQNEQTTSVRPRNREQEPLRFLVFSASLRTASFNTILAKIASRIIKKHGAEADFAEISEFDCSSFNQDVEAKKIVPPGAEEFRKRLLANDAFVISSPEYNASMPGLLKNMID